MKEETGHNFFIALLNHKVGRWFVFAVCFGIVAMVVIHIVDWNAGRHSTILWGLHEVNKPKGYPDSIYVDRIQFVDRAVADTGKKLPPPALKIEGKNINTGTNNGVIGDNATINGPIQPHPSQLDADEFRKLHPDTALRYLLLYSSSSQINAIWVQEFCAILEKNGYRTVEFAASIFNQQLEVGFTPLDKEEGYDVKYAVNVEKVSSVGHTRP